MTQPHKPGCKCKEMTCEKDCLNRHTHKTFWCKECHPKWMIPEHETPECDCNGMHEGSCPDPRAETPDPIADERKLTCKKAHCRCMNIGSQCTKHHYSDHCFGEKPRETWEERFDALVQECITKEKLKSFIASEIERAVKETEERKDKEYSDFVHQMNTLLNESDKAVLEEKTLYCGNCNKMVNGDHFSDGTCNRRYSPGVKEDIQEAVLEERRRIAEEVAKLKFTRKVTTDRIVFHDLYQDEVSTNRTVDAVLAIINPK